MRGMRVGDKTGLPGFLICQPWPCLLFGFGNRQRLCPANVTSVVAIAVASTATTDAYNMLRQAGPDFIRIRDGCQ